MTRLEFVDHPTQSWVSQCLPENLRETAYALPSDCADIAVILRHVWLSAHHRTETHHGWTIGDAAGRPNQTRVRELIHEVGSWNAHNLINPYSSGSGQPIREANALLPFPNREAGFFYLEFCKGADFLRKDSTIIEICIKHLEKKQEMKLLINLSSLSAFTDVNAVFLGKIDFRPGIYRLMYQTPGSPRIQPTQIKEAKFYDFAKSKYLILEE
ncbi:MAG: hypothetical protein NW226_12850 [Microscillaceae bacterium]|nr:hypothetical protein [Microscillaceae bacterium]